MSVARKMKNVRSNSNFGSFGSISPTPTTKDGINLPSIKITYCSIQYRNDRYEKTIWENGAWTIKKFPARQETECAFFITTEGSGKSLIYASFVDGQGKLQYLFVRRVGAGSRRITAKIPFRELPEFRLGVAKKLDSKGGTEHLTDKEVHGLTNNMLLISDTPDMYSTTTSLQGLGFGPKKFLEKYEEYKEEAARKSPTEESPAFANAAKDDTLKTASGRWRLWSGDLAKHKWDTHGYTGKKEGGEERAKGEAAVEGPLYVCDPSGYYAHRASTYLMVYDEKGNQLGYDAMEMMSGSYDGSLPAGHPVCMVGQFFVHDRQTIQGKALTSLGNAPQYGGLGDTRRRKKRPRWKKIHSHWAEENVIAPVKDRFEDTYDAVEAFVEDPSWESAAGIVTGGIVRRTKPLKAKNYDGQIV